MDINWDPGCSRAKDPDMALGSSPSTYDTVAPEHSEGHLN